MCLFAFVHVCTRLYAFVRTSLYCTHLYAFVRGVCTRLYEEFVHGVCMWSLYMEFVRGLCTRSLYAEFVRICMYQFVLYVFVHGVCMRLYAIVRGVCTRLYEFLCICTCLYVFVVATSGN